MFSHITGRVTMYTFCFSVWTSIWTSIFFPKFKKLAKLSTVHVIVTTHTLIVMRVEHFYCSLIAMTFKKDIL